MKIQKIKCDRCRAEWTKDAVPPEYTCDAFDLHDDPEVEYSIYKYDNLGGMSKRATTIDLCEKCQKDFTDWLSQKNTAVE